jgi:hypothetical protein
VTRLAVHNKFESKTAIYEALAEHFSARAEIREKRDARGPS